jgi:hypothetical protein
MSEETSSSTNNNPLADQSGDTLVMWGALAVIAVWVIFEVISEEYFLGTATVALAIVMVVIPRIDAKAIASLASPAAFMKLAGYGLVSLGVVELVADLRNNIFDTDGGTIIGALIAYAAFALTFFGARKIEV